MNIYKVEFEGVYPVGCCLVIAAENKPQAVKMAVEKLNGYNLKIIGEIKEVDISKPCIVEFLSGDY